jgi:hypothetical protein
MTIATISYSFDPPDYEGRASDIETLQDSIIAAMDYHFAAWEDAANAQAEYAALVAAVDAEGPGLFTPEESLRVLLLDHPRAAEWVQFLETAQDVGASLFSMCGLSGAAEPFAFTIKFNTATDTKAIRETVDLGPRHALALGMEAKGRGPG